MITMDYIKLFIRKISTKVIIILITSIVLCTSAQASDTIETQVITSPIFIDTPFTLRIKIKSDRKINISNIENLDNLYADYELINSNSKSKRYVRKGKISYETTLELYLLPKLKNQAKLSIVAMRYGDSSTKPINIKALRARRDYKNPVLLNTSVSKSSALVQEQIIYTLVIRSPLSLSNATLSALEIDNALVQPISQVRSSKEIYGINYEVLVIKYAIFPQQIGTLKIPEQKFVADVPINKNYDKVIPDMLGKSISQVSIPIYVDVKGPAYNDSPWLPLKGLQAKITWSNTDNLKVGDIITADISLMLDGITPSQVPVGILPQVNSSLKTKQITAYPSNVQKTQIIDTQSSSVKSHIDQQISYAISESGKITIPPIKISWWNTSKNKKETIFLNTNNINHKLLVTKDNGSRSVPNDAKAFEAKELANISQNNLEKHSASKTIEIVQSIKLFFSSYTLWIGVFATLIMSLIIVFGKRFFLALKHSWVLVKKYKSDETSSFFKALVALRAEKYIELQRNLIHCHKIWTGSSNRNLKKITDELPKNYTPLKLKWAEFADQLSANIYQESGSSSISKHEQRKALKTISDIRKAYLQLRPSFIGQVFDLLRRNETSLKSNNYIEKSKNIGIKSNINKKDKLLKSLYPTK